MEQEKATAPRPGLEPVDIEAGAVSATRGVTAASVRSGGDVSAAGNVHSANLSVSNTAQVGGMSDFGASALFRRDLTVLGCLRAAVALGAMRGLYADEQRLRQAVPRPHDGWFAYVGSYSDQDTPPEVWTAWRGAWTRDGRAPTAPALVVGKVDGMEADISDLRSKALALEASLSQLAEKHARLAQLCDTRETQNINEHREMRTTCAQALAAAEQALRVAHMGGGSEGGGLNVAISTNGHDLRLAPGERMTLTAYMWSGTSIVPQQDVSWAISRDSGDPADDDLWGSAVAAGDFKDTGQITIAYGDLGSAATASTTFTVTGTRKDGTSATRTLTFS